MKYHYKKGFSVLELSVSLGIIATILASSANMLSGGSTAAKRIDTINRMEIIEKAISSFVALYDRLPCPADIKLSKTNSSSGLEYCTGSFSYFQTSPTYSGITYAGNSNNYIVFGTIPYSALGLPKDYVADAWGNNFVYAVTSSMSGSGAGYGTPTTIYGLETINMGLLKVSDLNLMRTSTAAYVLMSVGNNGYGGYPLSSTNTRLPAPTNSGELQNYNALCQTSSANCGSFIAIEQTTSFDDIVHYKQKWQLVKEAGAVLSNQTCLSVKSLIATTDTGGPPVYYSSLCTSSPTDTRCPYFVNNFLFKIRELCLNQF